MYLIIAVGLRVFAGFGLSLVLAIMSIFIIWALFYFMDYLWPREVFVVLWFSMTGVGAGLGTAIAWFGSDNSTRVKVAQAGVWVAAGLLGAWAAYYYKTYIDPNPATFTSREISEAAVVTATVLPNIVASAIGLVRHLRTGYI